MANYTYLQPFIEDPNWQKLTAACLVSGGLIALSAAATSKIRVAENTETFVVPEKGFSLTGFFDLLLSGFISFHDSILGKEGRKYVPLTGTLFLFIFFSNLLGLVPGMPAITTTVWVNVGMALVVFFAFNFYGIKENGLAGYLKHFCGPIIILAPLLFPLELISVCLRILTLNLRLYWNISADHLVLGTFMDLIYGVPVFFYLMGTFVAFMQAFVFTILTMIYILLATQHEEEGH